MTGSDDSYSETRPISVAELLAKNGTIGAPPVSGRRRRRRGNADAVTVAELTGEIPIIRPTDPAPATVAVEEQVDADTPPSANGAVEVDATEGQAEPAEPEAAEPEATDEVAEASEVPDDQPAEAAGDIDVDEVAEQDTDPDREAEVGDGPVAEAGDDYAEVVAEYAAHLEHRDTDPDPVDFQAPPSRRFGFGRRSTGSEASGESGESGAVDPEQMSPDPLDDDKTDLVGSPVDVAEPVEIEDLDDEAALDTEDSGELPSYLRSTQGTLFGGQTVADDLARRGSRPSPEDIDLGGDFPLDEDLDEESHEESEDEDAQHDEPRQMSSFVHGLWIVGQSVIAVALGAGLFVAFDQLWKWNNIVALVLSVLVILGLVVGVRVVRKTEDIGSTLIAVAVGALVTLGPLALLQSG